MPVRVPSSSDSSAHVAKIQAIFAAVSLTVAMACAPGTSGDAPTSHDAGASAEASAGGSTSTDAGVHAHEAGVGGSGDGEAGVPDVADGATPPAADAGDAEPPCEPLTCSGLCGPVVEPCSGAPLECGGCGEGLACDLDGHRCVAPKIDCEALGAECGRTRNTCGKRLDCGDCADGMECDPNTSRCVPCTAPTCEDLGFECGLAWLGCGTREALTDCGKCDAGMVCNPDYNRCEPAPESGGGRCVPLPGAERCAADGAECGFVSDGCGGLAFCGDCPAGEGCALRGIQNRCSPVGAPAECAATGRECGKTTTACGERVDCGRCTAGLVCNDNGKCGAPCTPALPPESDAVPCGSFDDGCSGTIQKKCPPGGVCGDDHQCCVRRTCADDHPGKCGDGLDDGCGGVLDCACARGQACTALASGEEGSCCELPVRPDPAFCGELTNDCGTRKFGCGGGAACIEGQCCPLPACDGQCGTTLSNACGSVDCGCTSTERCMAGSCCVPRTCGGFYRKQCGQALDDGCGGTLDCGCGGQGNHCSEAVPGRTGTCSCAALDCGDYPNQCGRLANGCGGALDCTCADQGLPKFMRCGGGGDPGVCGCTEAACGARCGLVDDGCGGTMDCGPC